MAGMEDISCILCGSNNGPVVIEENGFDGKKCEPCSLIYISPRPQQQAVLNIYGHDDAYIPAHAHVESTWPKQLHARYMLKLIRQHCRRGSLLEIGAGAGYFLAEARKIGFDPFAIELNPAQAEFIRSTLNIPCDNQPLSYESWKDKQFDLIYHCDVISHLHDPLAELRVMYDKLKPGGHLVFETGNLGDVDPKYFSLIPAFQYPDPLFFFGQRSLREIVQRSGFKLIKMHQFNIAPQLRFMNFMRGKKLPAHTKKSAQRPLSRSSAIKTLLKNGCHTLSFGLRYHLGSWPVSLSTPQTVVLIAQKPLE